MNLNFVFVAEIYLEVEGGSQMGVVSICCLKIVGLKGQKSECPRILNDGGQRAKEVEGAL